MDVEAPVIQATVIQTTVIQIAVIKTVRQNVLPKIHILYSLLKKVQVQACYNIVLCCILSLLLLRYKLT